ncbi:MAG: hypothetical protein H6812_00170 [Phycisphaeraceae bacterium]|nr:hypothetical protein [Phycisphaeraceae bacterium]
MNCRYSLSAVALYGLACLSLLAACSRDPSMPESADAANDGTSSTDRVEIPATVRNNLGITFAKVERRRVESTIRMPGAFELQPLARHEYRMTLPGRVEIEVDQYQRVEPGDLLYRFLSPEWPELQHEIIVGEQEIEAANAAIGVARARTDEAEQRLAIMRERIASLSQAEVRNAELEAQVAEIEASLPRLRAELKQTETALANAHRTREHAMHRASAATGIGEDQLQSLVEFGSGSVPAFQTIIWIEVRAAEGGVVESLELTDGAFAEAPSLVLSIIDPGKVRFRALALQSDLARLVDIHRARIVPPVGQGIDVNDGVEARVEIGLEADPRQRTIAILATPEQGRPWIRQGVSAFLEVVVESTGGPALAIPRSSIVRDGVAHVFFRRDPSDPNKAIRVEADMGVDDGRWVAINSGVAPGDEIVLDGAYELKLASQQDGVVQKGGHVHADGTFHEGDH